MARRVGFAVYQLTIRQPRAQEPWTFRSGTNEDAYLLISTYLKDRLKRLIRLGEPNADGEYTDNRAVRLVKLDFDEDRRMIEGVFMKGEAGLVRPVYNLNTPESPNPSYTIQRDETDLAPLYFRFHLEDGQRFGIAILQTFGKEGLKSFLQDDLSKYFRSTVTVKLTQYLDGKVLTAMADSGKLQDVILINRGASQTSRSRMNGTKILNEQMGEDGDKLEFRLHRPSGWRSSVLRLLVRNRRRPEELRKVVTTPIGDGFDDLRVEIEQGGRTQTFSLMNPDDSPVRYDKHRDITIGRDGAPTFASLRSAADDVWLSVEKMLGWSLRDGN